MANTGESAPYSCKIMLRAKEWSGQSFSLRHRNDRPGVFHRSNQDRLEQAFLSRLISITGGNSQMGNPAEVNQTMYALRGVMLQDKDLINLPAGEQRILNTASSLRYWLIKPTEVLDDTALYNDLLCNRWKI